MRSLQCRRLVRQSTRSSINVPRPSASRSWYSQEMDRSLTWAGRTIVVMLLIPVTGFISTVLPRPFVLVPILLTIPMFYGIARTVWHLHLAAKLRRQEYSGQSSPFRNPLIRFLNERPMWSLVILIPSVMFVVYLVLRLLHRIP
jgi:hypothetical protein